MVTGDGANAARPDAPELASALDRLKRRGSALLVVGSVPADVYRTASARMLGDGERRRLVVRSASDCADNRTECARRQTPEWTRIIEYDASARSVAAACADPSTGPDSPAGPDAGRATGDSKNPLAQRVGGDAVELGAEVTKTIEQFESISGGLAPAELRLAFDCLPVLLAEYDLETTFQFAHILTNHVRSVNGMGHFWLPRERDDHAVRVLEPLFEATVELELEGSNLRQRWHFHEMDFTSDWLVFG